MAKVKAKAKKTKVNFSNNLLGFQKIIFYIFLAFYVFAQFVSEVSKIQALPFLIFTVTAYFFLYQKKPILI